jgi:hypothetical protein
VTSGTTNGALGGAAGGDDVCANEAQAEAGVSPRVRGRQFTAWLSTSAAPVGTRIVHGTGPYIRVDGARVADNFAALLSGALESPIVLDATGTAVPTNPVWTGTAADGGPSGDCASWSSESSTDVGVVGTTSQTSTSWTASGSQACSAPGHLYCIEL